MNASVMSATTFMQEKPNTRHLITAFCMFHSVTIYIEDKLLDGWLDLQKKNNNNEVFIYNYSEITISSILNKYLKSDQLKALGSVVLVFIYLRIMLGSFFLTTVGMLEIIFSLPIALTITQLILQIKIMTPFHTLVLFIVLAIGADDIFVFMDAYKISAGKGPEVLGSFETRMSWVYRRAVSAMLITSTTTFIAFLTVLTIPLASARSFGIFAAFVILFDYLLVMTLFSTSVVIYHDRFESNNNFCCGCAFWKKTFWKKSDPTPTQSAIKNYQDGVELPIGRISHFFKVRTHI